MLRKIVFTAVPAAFAAAAVKQNENVVAPAKQPEIENLEHYKCRPSDLPMYTPLHAHNKPVLSQPHPPKSSALEESIESGIQVVRTELQTGYNLVSDKVKIFDEYYETAKAHTAGTIDYLNQPHNVLPRSGAIAIGGLAGFIFAARGGFIKKVLYTTVGAGAIASICYPSQAEHLARDALFQARKGYAIAYNFVKGVKPGDETPIEPINKFPSSIQDVKFLMWDLYDEAKDTLFGKKDKKDN